MIRTAIVRLPLGMRTAAAATATMRGLLRARPAASAATQSVVARSMHSHSNAGAFLGSATSRSHRHSSSSSSSSPRLGATWAALLGAGALFGAASLVASSDNEVACAPSSPFSSASSSSSSATATASRATPPSGRSVYSFGNNNFGCLGLGLGDDRGGRATPELVPALAGVEVVQLVAAGNHAAALDAQGRVYTWGSALGGLLGQGGGGAGASAAAAAGVCTQPALVTALEGHRIVHVALSETHAAAVELLPSGETRVWTWGSKALGFSVPAPSSATPGAGAGTYYRPGGDSRVDSRGSIDARVTDRTSSPVQAVLPQIVPGLLGQRIVKVACGRRHTLALGQDGRVWTFGSDREGALGVGDTLPRIEPVLIDALSPASSMAPTASVLQPGERIVAIGAAGSSSLFVSSSGAVWACGSNERGQAGTGGSQRRYLSPVRVAGLRDVESVALGALHALALDQRGQAWSWGWNQEGQGGVGDRSLEHRFPLMINGSTATGLLKDQRVSHLAAGFGHSAAVTQQGQLFLWGRGREGQLGRGDQVESIVAAKDSPVECKFFTQRGLQVTQAAAGADFTLALVKQEPAAAQQ